MTTELSKVSSRGFGASAALYFLLFATVFAAIASRRFDILANPQPWAEDGAVWMAQAYNNGILQSLLQPQNGYFQTISRISYGLGLAFGLETAPFVATTIAISIRAGFALFLLSRRFESVPFALRICAVVYFVLMPNMNEAYVNVTNAHWYLALYLLAVILAEEPRSRLWRIHDIAILIISGLSGPFVVFLAPALLIKRLAQRNGLLGVIKGIGLFDIILTACFLTQVISILSTPETRSSAPLGFSVPLLLEIVANRVILGSVIPAELAAALAQNPLIAYTAPLLLFVLLCVFLVRGNWQLRAAATFVILMMGFAFAWPMNHLTEPQLPFFLLPYAGDRYFIIPNFCAFCFALLVIYRSTCRVWPAAVVTTALIPLLALSYFLPPLPRSPFLQDVATFQGLDAGEAMSIRINPEPWVMNLIKR